LIVSKNVARREEAGMVTRGKMAKNVLRLQILIKMM